MTKREALELTMQNTRLRALGISGEDADTLRRISMTLRRWFEHECNGTIQRDGDDGEGKPFAVYGRDHEHRDPVADRETGARKRLAAIMTKYPGLLAYVQGDPRGCSVYILKASQVGRREDINSVYTRGVAVS